MLAKNNKCISVEFKSIVEHDDGGFGSTHKFLVVNQDGKLKIADWYEPSFVGDREMDYYTRGDIKNLNNPKRTIISMCLSLISTQIGRAHV